MIYLPLYLPDEHDFYIQKDTLNESNDTLNDTLNLSDKEKIIFELIKSNDRITIAEVMTDTGFSRPTVTRALNILKEKQLLERVGSRKTGRWKWRSDMIIWMFTVLYAAMMVVTGIVEYRYSEEPGRERNTQNAYVLSKMVTSALFLVIALASYKISGNSLFIMLMPGFLCCFLGDLFLALGYEIDNRLKNPQFITGVICFCVGQVIISLAMLQLLHWHISWTIIIPFAVLGYTIYCYRSNDYEFGINGIPCMAYGFLVGLSAGLGLQLILTGAGVTETFLGTGAILFLISDAVLSMKLFWKKEVTWAGAGVLVFYFGAMWFLSTAISMGM